MATAPSESAGRYDDFVDARIAKTRAAVKSADVATGVVTLLAGLLVLLLIAAVADHWLVAGGLDRWERYALLAIGGAGAGLYIATRLAPALLGRVNPLYAAREIERESPGLKNSLLNLLQLRGGAEPAAVRQTLERQAAERLAQTGDAPIDHTPLVRVAKLLLALVAIAGVYVVASPKDFFASAGRVLAPWSDIAAPSRVRLSAIEPGSVTLAQGERLRVSAMATGLAEGELLELVYTTADRRDVDRRVPMTASSGGLHFTATLPPGGGAAAALGLQGDLTYRLEAGDARSANYRVDVLTAPTIAPVVVRYDYPAYTGLTSREVEGVGDLRALEGTRVTLTAETNLPIEAAQVDLGADGRPDARMRVDGQRATGVFTLRHDGDGATSSTSYVLRFSSPDGQANHDPPQYRVEVIADLRPEAAIVEPEEKTRDVAVNEPVRFTIEARDPDFALKQVRLIGEKDGRRVLQQDVLTGDGRGRFVGETDVTPQAIGLRPGDVLDYWAEATDNRTPQPGVGVSERRRLRVTGPAEGRPGERGRGEGGQPQQDPGAEGRPNEGAGQDGGGQPNQPQQGNQPGDQLGGERQPGENQAQRDGEQQDRPGEQQQDQGQEGQRGQEGQEGQEGQQGQEGQESQQRDAGESNEGEEGQSPGGGMTGAGDQGGENSSDEATPGAGAEGDGSSDPQQNGPQGGQSGGQNGDGASDAQRDQGGAGGDPRQGAGEGAEPVARDGSDDGSAFDRIQDWLKQQGSGEGQPQEGERQRPAGEEGDPSDSSGETRDAQGQPGDSKQTGQSSKSDGRREGQPGEQDGAQDGADERGSQGDARDGSSASTPQPRDGQGGETPDRAQDGPGAGAQDRQGEQSDSKSSDSGGDTPPGESSDRSKDGPREGTDGAGQSQAADRGAGQSADRGAGDSTGRAGGEQESDSPTGGEQGDSPGESGKTGEGKSSEGRDGEQRGGQQGEGQQQDGAGQGDGEQPGASQGDQPNQRGADGPNSVADRRGEGGPQGDPGDGENAGQLGGPMELGDRGPMRDGAGAGAESGGDAANLDYAREQTELVLQRLEDQLRKKEVDRRLLDKLGWTEEDLRRFVERWQTRRERAAERGAEGEAELDRALRSLGLEPGGPTATRELSQDDVRDLQDRARTKAPPRLREWLERYNRSLNSAGDPPTQPE